MKVGEYSSNLQTAYSANTQPTEPNTVDSTKSRTESNQTNKSASTENAKTNAKDQSRIRELQTIDASVRAHEAAHLAAAGGLAKSGANFTYTKGPDGKLYASGGEVSIDTSKADTPDATILKMARVRAAALAPADPSPQDRGVAAQAAQTAAQAARELAEYNRQGKPTKAAKAQGQNLDLSV